MRNITINLPNSYIEVLEIISKKNGTSRSELIRQALKEFLESDFALVSKIAQLFPEIEVVRQQNLESKRIKEERLKKIIEQKKEKEFYNYCIMCEHKLDRPSIPLKHKGLDIIELRFCCNCFEKYKGKTLEEFPEFVLNKIREKMARYRKFREKKEDDRY